MDGVGRVKLGFLGQAHLKRAVQMAERVGQDLLHIAPEILLPSFPSSPPPPPPSSSPSSLSSSSSLSPRPQQSPRASSPSQSQSSAQTGEEEGEGKETEKADVYSFGWMMEEMWSGGEGKREWRGEGGREVRTWGEVMERVVRGGERPVGRAGWPRSLASLITSCWSSSPSLRPSFQDILRQIDTIVADCLISDPSGRHLWTRYYLGKDKVVWEKLGSAMISQLALKMTTKDVAMRCVKSILDEKDTGSVSINDFNDFLQWFGPLTRNTFSEVHALLKEPWFHGFIAVGQAESRVSRAKPGSFLVRFSSSSPGSFALTVLLDKSNIRHYRIDKRRNQFFLGKSSFPSLHELIRKHKSSLCLKTPCPGSPYYFLFNEVETTGYQIVFH